MSYLYLQGRTIIRINNNHFLKYFKCIPKKLENIVGQMSKIHTYVTCVQHVLGTYIDYIIVLYVPRININKNERYICPNIFQCIQQLL